jgi:branched-chain amino acid transport system permease protein
LPLFISSFFILLVTEIMIMGLFAMSFNLLFGYTGLLSFGHAAFFGVGGYATALFIRDLAPSMGGALLAGILFSAIAAAIIGFFAVKLDEIYFAIITLGFGMMVFTIVHQWRGFTGGSDGVTGFPLPPLRLFGLSFDITSPSHYYLFTTVVVIVSVWILWKIIHSPFGLILKAIRENPERIAFTGINVRLYRWLAFLISGILAGVAGSLFAPFDRMASPSMVHWTKSAEPVLMTILGGSGIFLGPLFGSAVFFILEHFITNYTESWMIFLGAILIPMVIFFPEGILGTLMHWLNRTRGTNGR